MDRARYTSGVPMFLVRFYHTVLCISSISDGMASERNHDDCHGSTMVALEVPDDIHKPEAFSAKNLSLERLGFNHVAIHEG